MSTLEELNTKLLRLQKLLQMQKRNQEGVGSKLGPELLQELAELKAIRVQTYSIKETI